MTQFNPPPAAPYDPQNQFDAEMMPPGPAPMSGMAVAGLVCSLVICCPVVSPLLGLIFSIVGLVQTKGGRYRGRGLAIAGILVSLLFNLPIQGYGGYCLANAIGDQIKLTTAMMNELDKGDIDACASTLYELGSPGFKATVSETELADWLKQRLDVLGGLQSIGPSQQQGAVTTPGTNIISYVFQAQFPETSVPFIIEISFDYKSGHMRVVDIIIDEESLMKEKGQAEDTLETDSQSEIEKEAGISS